jgi:hypothetical protein
MILRIISRLTAEICVRRFQDGTISAEKNRVFVVMNTVTNT